MWDVHGGGAGPAGGGAGGRDSWNPHLHVPPPTAMCYQVPPTPGKAEAKLDPESQLSSKDLISEPVRNVLECLSAKKENNEMCFFHISLRRVWKPRLLWSTVPVSKPALKTGTLRHPKAGL